MVEGDYGIVKSQVAEAPRLEIRAQLAVNARKQIEIECGGHARCVVVGGAERQLVPVISDEDEPYSYMLYSPEIRLYSSRLKRLMPDYRSAQKVYDNGDVQIYLKRP